MVAQDSRRSVENDVTSTVDEQRPPGPRLAVASTVLGLATATLSLVGQLVGVVGKLPVLVWVVFVLLLAGAAAGAALWRPVRWRVALVAAVVAVGTVSAMYGARHQEAAKATGPDPAAPVVEDPLTGATVDMCLNLHGHGKPPATDDEVWSMALPLDQRGLPAGRYIAGVQLRWDGTRWWTDRFQLGNAGDHRVYRFQLFLVPRRTADDWRKEHYVVESDPVASGARPIGEPVIVTRGSNPC